MELTQFYPLAVLPLAWTMDRLLGDPSGLPHPVVGFGKLIAAGEKRLNKGEHRLQKGACLALALIAGTFVLMFFLQKWLNALHPAIGVLFSILIAFTCLAGKGLIDEVKQVFIRVDESVEKGRVQVARIVGRDTSTLSAQQIRTAALETLSENLSDGVIAPVFWYLLLGVPGMFAYKMINTLDSMIGYKNERYKQFGCWAAHIDDLANYVPARLTAWIMAAVSGQARAFVFIKKYGRKHASPNSGYPEAALAGILDCRFGGPNPYFGRMVNKPFIGNNPRTLTTADMRIAVGINRKTEIGMLILVTGLLFAFQLIVL